MQKKYLLITALVFTLLAPSNLFASTPKAGSKCPKLGATQTASGKKFTCVKSGEKLVWDKGVVTPKPKVTASPSPSSVGNSDQLKIKAGDQCTSTDRGIVKATASDRFICKHDGVSAYRWFLVEESTNPSPSPTVTQAIENIDWGLTRNTDSGYLTPYNGPCSKEIYIQQQWVDLVRAFEASGNCSGIYHLAKYVLGSERPKTSLISNYLPIEQCKITEPRDSKALRGFYSDWEPGRIEWTSKRKVPNAKMTVQVVPIYAEDTASPINSPYFDYGRFTNYIKEWIDYSADIGSQVEFRYPDKYLKFNGRVSSYGLYHENNHDHPGTAQFTRDLIAQVDNQIDFSNADLVMVLVPAGTPFSKFGQATLPELRTQEGTVVVGTTENPYTLEELGLAKLSELLIPFWWIHELFHSGIGYADHYGDNKRSPFTEYGMGTWSLLTPWGGDLNGWEKWTLGFISNSQVHCLDTAKQNTIWLAPTSVQSKERKVAIIPISRNKGIAIESVRAAGLYYKISSGSQGVLVYEIDLTIVDPDLGLKLVLPKNRDSYSVRFFMDQATLRQGEFVVSSGYKITVVEAGNFGDVVKVEKA